MLTNAIIELYVQRILAITNTTGTRFLQNLSKVMLKWEGACIGSFPDFCWVYLNQLKASQERDV